MPELTVNSVVPPVEKIVGPRIRPLGGLEVNRVWPTARRRLVGPFIFFDHMLRAPLPAGVGLDVPPHPHIGIATITYLFEGELTHADSLGSKQVIRPGEVNWMAAGGGITHSERTTDEDRARASHVHGIQCWVALPKALEDGDPSFTHYPRELIPQADVPGFKIHVLAGEAFGQRSAVSPGFELFYAEAYGQAAASLLLSRDLGQRAIYVVDGVIDIASGRFEKGRCLVLEDGDDIELVCAQDCHLMLFGGPPMDDGERHIWWNFVSTDLAAIARARADWREHRFPKVPGDDDYMPLPSR